MYFVEQKHKLWQKQNKIENRKSYTVLERRTLCFSSYKNLKLKVKLWWVGACEREKRVFSVLFLSEGNFFNTYVLSQCTVYWIYFQDIVL